MSFAAVGALISSNASAFSLTPGGVGHLILAEVVNEDNNTVVCTGLSSSNVAWSQLGPTVSGTVKSYTGVIFAGRVTSTGAATVTASWSGSAPVNVRIVGQEFSSTLGVWSRDGVQGVLDNVGTGTWPSLTPSASGDLYFGWAFDSATAVAGSTPGYTYVVDPNSNGAAYNLNCTAGVATGPVWGDSTMQFGVSVLLKESAPPASGTAAYLVMGM